MFTGEEFDRILELVFGKPDPVVANGSDGVDDDPFVVWESPEAAELYA